MAPGMVWGWSNFSKISSWALHYESHVICEKFVVSKNYLQNTVFLQTIHLFLEQAEVKLLNDE